MFRIGQESLTYSLHPTPRFILGDSSEAANRQVESAAHDVLDRREHLISTLSPQFADASQRINEILRARSVSHANSNPATRYIYDELLSSTTEHRWLWPHLPVGDFNALEKSQAFKFFCASMNKYIQVQDNDIKTRHRWGTLTLDSYPYAIHTHVELKNFLLFYGLGKSYLSHALSEGHDLDEEGVVVLGGMHESQFNSRRLIDHFADNNLGRELAIGIPTLTESPYEIMKRGINGKLIQKFVGHEGVRDIWEAAQTRYPKNTDRLEKVLIQDPLVFGGLAVQIEEVIERLLNDSDDANAKLTKIQMLDLANSVLEVELVDRMSDISDIHMLMHMHKDFPDFGRFRVLLYTSRMLNMFEKLSKSIYKTENRDSFDLAKEGYLGILGLKLQEINKVLKEHGQDEITAKELLEFYNSTFKTLQDNAEITMQELISERRNAILEPLLY